MLYSPSSVAELWAGARPNEFDALNQLFEALVCARIDAEVGRGAGAYMHRYRRSHGIEIADAFIAAAAVANKAML